MSECVHCGQALPHAGTGWRESARCRAFQEIAEQAWNEGFERGAMERAVTPRQLHRIVLVVNPYSWRTPTEEPSA